MYYGSVTEISDCFLSISEHYAVDDYNKICAQKSYYASMSYILHSINSIEQGFSELFCWHTTK